jgi:hypothetical protein
VSAVAGMFLTALLSVLGRLATAAFFEAVLTKVIVYCGEKLAPMTTNTLDDEIVAEIKARLQGHDR